MLIGLALIAIPLLVAIVTAALQMRTLADTTQQLVRQSVQVTRLTQDLASIVASLERTTRLYQLLGDRKLLAVYRQNDLRLDRVREQLAPQLGNAESGRQLRELIRLQRALRDNLETPRSPRTFANNIARLELMSGIATTLATRSNAVIDAALAELTASSAAARNRLLWLAGLLVPLIIAAVLILTWLVARPLGQIDRAISDLGRGDFSRGIAVSGTTDLEKLGKQLEWLRQRLLELAEERSRFLRHMSHELKTPLANIREGTDLLMEGAVGKLDTAQHEIAAILRDNGIRLQRLIENLLSFSAWQSQTASLDVSEFSARALIKQVLENQQLTLLSQRVRLEVRVDEVSLVADRAKLRLIIDNLLSNAIKYSPRGGNIHVLAKAENNDFVLDIADSGNGIPAAERERVFEAFYTGKAPAAGSLRGTGIGLSVVMEFVNAHRGTVQIIDGEYKGAHFRVRMPLHAS